VHLVGSKKRHSSTKSAHKDATPTNVRYYVLRKMSRPDTGEKFYQIAPIEDYVEFQKCVVDVVWAM
jgi:hypothetical protein